MLYMPMRDIFEGNSQVYVLCCECVKKNMNLCGRYVKFLICYKKFIVCFRSLHEELSLL